MNRLRERVPLVVFLSSVIFVFLGGSFLYGAFAYKFGWPPIPQLMYIYAMVEEVVSPSDRILETSNLLHDDPLAAPLPEALQPGLVLVAADIVARQTSVKVMDRTGRVIHEWRPVWSEIWPEGEGNFVTRPVEGMYLHGLDLLPDGSLVANFEHQSTFRLDPCGNLLWKLDNLGHHSVHYADDGTLWVSAEDYIAEAPTGIPNYDAPVRSWKLQQLNLDGEILRNIPVIGLLQDNDLHGLLYLAATQNRSPSVSGDTLHLNDIETFPANMQSEIFTPGDLLISLRNINTVLVIDPKDLKVKFISVGRVLRQHDPDFVPGDRISIFDNHNVPDPKTGQLASRIVEIDVASGIAATVLKGTGEEPFYTDIMGVHQRLANGNILVVPSGEGRVLEFTPEGRLSWRWDNRVSNNLNRRVYMAKILPANMDEAFFQARQAACKT